MHCFYKKNIFVFAFSLCLSSPIVAQRYTISGYVRDASSKESLIGSIVYETVQNKGTSVNEYGYFSLTLNAKDTLNIIISYVGYKPQAKKILLTRDLRLDFFLESASTLNEVEISTAKNNNNVSKPVMGVIDVPMREIKNLPVLAGERDILKIIQLLPGVQQAQEGTTGFFVRGGNTDQNLVQLDEATVYNPNHLFGIFSTFNVNALNNVQLIKGGFPAKYGGRLSSILDITMKDGNKEKYEVEGGIGLLSSNITLQGPIKKNNSSFIISARRSYLDLIVKPFLPANNKGTTYKFYDLNAKLNFELGKNDRIFLSAFKGNDYGAYTGANSLNYDIGFGNTTATLRWTHLFGSKLFCNTSAIVNQYHLGLGTTQGKYYALLYTAVNDVNGKTDFTYIPNSRSMIKFGASYFYHTLYPASYSASIPKKGQRMVINKDSIPRKYSNEMAFYISHEWDANEIFSINYGVRIPYFFTNNSAYLLYEPRVTTKFSIEKTSSIKASYTVMHQFLHLVPNSTASLPTDIWISSSNIVKPQRSEQYALGYFKNFKNNLIETSVELYYKTMQNQVLFKEGTQLTLVSNIEDALTFGKGNSYGAEFFIRKNTGRLTGWISYTLSKTTQTFQALNLGKPFPFAYDRRHNIAVVGTYDINTHWTISADFVFHTGNAFTIPSGLVPVSQDGSLYDGYFYDYTSRNNARLRSYHRLDINASYKRKHRYEKWGYDSELSFGAYNVYSRLNPYFVYLTVDAVTKIPQAVQVSLLPIIPSISYNFKF